MLTEAPTSQAVPTLAEAAQPARIVLFGSHACGDDMAALLDVMTDAGLPAPPHAGRLDELNPFAVEARCGWSGTSTLDRITVTLWLGDLMRWSIDRLGAQPR